MSRHSAHIHEHVSKEKIHVVPYGHRTIEMSQGKKDVVKVAVEIKGQKQLYEMDQTKKLQDIIKDLCKDSQNWSEYSLQIIDTEQFITESNQHEVRDGAMLRLVTSPSKAVENLLNCLRQNSSEEEKLGAYKQLYKLSRDLTFASNFIDKKGLTHLIDVVERGTCVGESLAHALGAVINLLDHGLTTHDQTLSRGFIRKICRLVTDNGGNDATILQRSLAILEDAVISSLQLYQEIAQEVSVNSLTSHLQKSNPEIQHNTIALINALFMRTPNDSSKVTGRRKISDPKQFRTVVLNHIIRSSKPISSEMAHQLYVLQVLTFNILEERMMTKVNPNDREQRENIFDLRSTAFDSVSEISPVSKRGPTFNSEDFKKLGFENFNNPVLEFDQTPPGIFALDCMRYFSEYQQDNYIRMVLENSARGDKHECPFAKSSVHLVKMICDILKIGEQPTETGEHYYSLFFTHDHAIEEFYCICIQHLNKIWKEMSAIKEDFDKVMSVVHDQIIYDLEQKPTSLETFRTKLMNYNQILKIRERERIHKEEFDSQAAPVLELQREIEPSITGLVGEQRLNFLKAGTVFNKISNKKFREKSHWYCRLSPNQKFLHYSDVDNNTHKPSIEEMPGKLNMAEVKDVIFGKNCPHIKNAKLHKQTADLAFSISYDPDEFLNFVAPDKDTCEYWADGLNVLLGKKMTSEKARHDVEMLLGMEMKLRLLELENIPIPDQPPPVPPLPNNYNFAYKF